MNIISRFFGKIESDSQASPLIANLRDNPIALTVLFSRPNTVTSEALSISLKKLGGPLSKATVELEEGLRKEGTTFGLVGWENHVIQMVGFNAPMPKTALENCVAPAHFPQESKELARNHTNHLILYYAGHADSPFEQYCALTALAGAFAQLDGIFILNETARTSLPLQIFIDPEVTSQYFEFIESLPPLMLFCGFVKYEVEGTNGVWMRTYGAERFGQPNFAALASGHHEGERYSNIFTDVLGYLISSDAEIGDGHTMQIGENEFFRLRNPLESEYFLKDDNPLFVAEIINETDINDA